MHTYMGAQLYTGLTFKFERIVSLYYALLRLIPLVIPTGVREVAVVPPHVMRVRRVPKDEPTKKKVSHTNQERGERKRKRDS